MSKETIGDNSFKQEPDITQAFLRQIDRTNQAAMISPEIHERSIRQTASNLPMKWREWAHGQDDRYTDYDKRYNFKTIHGHDIGSKEDPMLVDPSKPVRRLPGPIDWSDHNIIEKKNVGTKKEPYYEPILADDSKPVKRIEPGPIDWTDPNIYSPKLDETPLRDSNTYNDVIMEAGEYAGLTWQEENINSIKAEGKDD